MNHLIPFSRSVLSLSLAALLSVSGSAWSETITGAPGTPGVNGNAGNPGTAGTNGEGGGDAVASGTLNLNDINAFSIGGDGGKGGNGGVGLADGNGGAGGNGGSGGNASSVAVQVIPNNILIGNASATVTARGGKAGAPGLGGAALGAGTSGDTGEGANGGNAQSSANIRATGNVTVTASSIGGDGSGIFRDPRVPVVVGNGGKGDIDVAYGESTNGGEVNVTAIEQGGSGGSATFNGDSRNTSNAGKGANAIIISAVNGDTSGSLNLSQAAIGGSSGNVSGGNNGRAGVARSVLKKRTSSNSLTLKSGANGGNGGNRTLNIGTATNGATGRALAEGTNDAGIVDLLATSRGGSGGNGANGANGGAGGSAQSFVKGRTFGEGQNISLNTQSSGGEGGSVLSGDGKVGNGGRATSVAIGDAVGNTRIVGDVLATGGKGGSVLTGKGNGGNGGLGIVRLSGNVKKSGVELGNGLVGIDLHGIAQGGSGGSGVGVGSTGGDGGKAIGSVTVGSIRNSQNNNGEYEFKLKQIGGDGGSGLSGANGGVGANSVMKDAFNILTKSELDLHQDAQGGDGGLSVGGVAGLAGNASSSLTLRGRNGHLRTSAIGGKGGDGLNGSSGAVGGDAIADMLSLSAGDFSSYSVRARGGQGGSVINGSGNAGNGGSAQLGRVYAESITGGVVSVDGLVSGGDGGNANGTGKAGNGFGIFITDAVDGATRGDLSLSQRVFGGASGDVLGGRNGSAGSASSILNKTTSSKSLRLFSQAIGGAGGARQSRNGVAARGGSSNVSVEGINREGVTNVETLSIGGAGGVGTGGADSGAGGNANSIAIGRGFSEGLMADIDVRGVANAGDGGSNDTGVAGAGGNAVSFSKVSSSIQAVGGGFNQVNAFDIARGGQGGFSNGAGTGARGGDADSRADSEREIGAISRRRVSFNSTSRAIGGAGSGNQRNGTANSFAIATGTEGSSKAVADSGIATNRNYAGAVATATVAGDLTSGTVATSGSRARASDGNILPKRFRASQLSATAYATLLPNAADAATLIAGNTNVESAILGNEALATGFLGAAFSENGIATSGQLYSSSIDFNIDMNGKANGDLSVGLFDSITRGDHGFDSLLFKIMIEDIEVESLLFSSLAAAENYFNDNALSFGLWGELISDDNVLDLKFSLDLTEQHVGQGFSTNLIAGAGTTYDLAASPRLAAATVVPVPAAVWLFGSGLLGLLTVVRRRK